MASRHRYQHVIERIALIVGLIALVLLFAIGIAG